MAADTAPPRASSNPKAMSEDELRSALRHQYEIASGNVGGEITEDRRKLLEHYRREPYGTEVEGRSAVITSDIFDTIESMMPDFMEIFGAGGRPLEFEPRDKDERYDEDALEQHAEDATDIINWSLMRDNPGFMIMYDAFKTALVQIQGIVKTYWDDSKQTTTHWYEHVTDEEMTILEGDDEIEILEHSEVLNKHLAVVAEQYGIDPDTLPTEQIEAFLETSVDEETRQAIGPVRRHNLKIRRTTKRGRQVVVGVAPENFGISRRAQSLKDADYLYDRSRVSITDLLNEGFDPDLVRGIPSGDESEYNEERTTRFERDDEWPFESDYVDESTRMVWKIEHFIKVDYDGDGLGELRKVTTAGSSFTVLDNVEVPEHPYVDFTPIREPYKFWGHAVAELVDDLQLLHTTIWRQTLDNIYQINNQRHVINQRVNEDDVLSNIVGGVIHAKGSGPVGDAIQPLAPQSIIQYTAPLMEMIEDQKSKRTGQTPYSQGMDSEALNKTWRGMSALLNRTQRRMMLIARLFAEGMKELGGKMLRSHVAYAPGEMSIRLRAREWKSVDPRTWNENMDVNVSAGLGHGTTEMRAEGAVAVLQAQKELIDLQGGPDGPFVKPHHLRNALQIMVEDGYGFSSADPFFAEIREDTPVKMPERQDPKMAEIQQKGQIAQAEMQLDAQKSQAEMQVKQQTAQSEERRKEIDGQREHERKMHEIELEHQRKLEQMQMEFQAKMKQILMEAEIKREAAQAQAAISAQAQRDKADMAAQKPTNGAGD